MPDFTPHCSVLILVSVPRTWGWLSSLDLLQEIGRSSGKVCKSCCLMGTCHVRGSQLQSRGRQCDANQRQTPTLTPPDPVCAGRALRAEPRVSVAGPSDGPGVGRWAGGECSPEDHCCRGRLGPSLGQTAPLSPSCPFQNHEPKGWDSSGIS